MESDNRTITWPIQCFLCLLFAMAISAPRGWETIAHRDAGVVRLGWSTGRTSRWASATPVSLRLASIPAPTPSATITAASVAATAPQMDRETDVAQSLIEREPAPAVAVEITWDPPQQEPAAEAVATVETPQPPPMALAPSDVGPMVHCPLDPVNRPWEQAHLASAWQLFWQQTSGVSATKVQPVEVSPASTQAPPTVDEAALRLAQLPATVERPSIPIVRSRASLQRAPRPESLLRELEMLSTIDPASPWAWQVAILVQHLWESPLSEGPVHPDLHQLEHLVTTGLDAADRIDDPALASRWRRAAYSIERRLSVWKAASLGGAPAALDVARDPRESKSSLASHRLSSQSLALAVEAYELEPSAAAARILARAIDEMQRDSDKACQSAARELAAYYDQANVRLAVTSDFLSRMMPQMPITESPVRDSVEGAQIRGRSISERALRVEMIPDPNRFRVLLAGSGDITAHTVATKGPGQWFNRADSTVEVQRELTVGPDGFTFQPAEGQASASLRLLQVRTKLEGVPLFGELLRRTLASAGEKKQPQARRRLQSRVQREAVAELETLSDQKLAELRTRLEERLARPLREMNVPSEWISALTTEERASLRLRVAGGDQLGAHTPRPRAPSDSLVSFQVHQSACNNVLAGLELGGQSYTLQELFAHVAQRLNRPTLKESTDLPQGVRITLADNDPVRVTFREGVVELALRVERLSSGDQEWRDFLVRARYAPNAETGVLEREESIRLVGAMGQRLSTRTQFALRSIFTKVFSKNQRLDVLKPFRDSERTASLSVGQFAAEEGWLAVALVDRSRPAGPQVASR